MRTQTNNDVLAVMELESLNAMNSRHFRELIKAVLTDAHRVVEVDCSRVTFMDSEGLGALLSAHKLVAPRNGRVRLTHVQPTIRQLLELLKLQHVFQIVN